MMDVWDCGLTVGCGWLGGHWVFTVDVNKINKQAHSLVAPVTTV